MEIPDIPKLEELLSEFIPKNKKIIKCEKRRLTAPGDNYASLILAIDIFLEDENSKTETIHTAVKLLPNEFMRQFMNVPFTFRNELGFYETIIPTLRTFQKKQGSKKTLDFFAKFYTGRLNIDRSLKTLDDNAIIILENLKSQGYALLDNHTGLDLEITKLILTQMAEFHSAVIALRETQRAVFDDKLMPFFEKFKIFVLGENELFSTSEKVVEAITKVIQEDEHCAQYIDRIRKTIQKCVDHLNLPKNSPQLNQGVFSSLVHYDLWINNMMVKIREDKTIDVKFLDWQLYEYASVATDFLFFMTSSAQDKIFAENFDDLIKFYYENLISNLKELKCDTAKFGFDVFEKEFKTAASQIAYFYILGALPSIFPSEDHMFEAEEISAECLLAQFEVSDICRKRIYLMTRKFIEKGWI